VKPLPDPASPDPRVELEGYLDELAVVPGASVRVMLSAPAGEATVQVARLIHLDEDARGPGRKEEAVDWGQSMSVRVEKQRLDLGSYVEIPHAPPLRLDRSFALALWVHPTLRGRRWQALAAKWLPGDLGFVLLFSGFDTLTAGVGHADGSVTWLTAHDPVEVGAWQLVVLSVDCGRGEACLYQWSPVRRLTRSPMVLRTPPSGSSAALLFGALQHPEEPTQRWAHFNGKIGRPVLFGSALTARDVEALARATEPASVAPVLASWDLSRDVGTRRVVDVSGEHHGLAVNAPARAVTGPGWAGSGGELYTDAPERYDAIHLHEDDLDDAGWLPTLELTVPAGARSGIHLVEARKGTDCLRLPFVVSEPAPRSETALLLPTMTWQAYSSNRMAYNNAEDGTLDRSLCLYDLHADGSLVRYTTFRKPTRSWLSGSHRLWGVHNLKADLYLVDWLEVKGFGYDVLTDHDLHGAGLDRVRPYRCIVLGSHPEYWTERMLRALMDYVQGGGHVLCLGGNALWWVTSVDPERHHLIEVRKTAVAKDPWMEIEPGEAQHSTSLELGGEWARRGYPPRSILGVEFSASVFVASEGERAYRRLPTSHDPRYAWVFAGVDTESFGDAGLNQGSAAGFEVDAFREYGWGPGVEVAQLARATDERFVPIPDLPGTPAADIVLVTHPAGGAVFSAGSVTWTGSLSWDGYNGPVSRITENVLRRFIEAPPGEAR
jgi:N,N-dimethylformamidase